MLHLNFNGGLLEYLNTSFKGTTSCLLGWVTLGLVGSTVPVVAINKIVNLNSH